MLINSNLFNQISFFLSSRVKVESLEVGATSHGGATQLKSGIYSNIQESNFITIDEIDNTLSVFIPSTITADQKINPAQFVKKYYNIIEAHYNQTITILKTKGAWYSEDMRKVIKEDITILTLNKREVSENDIQFFLNLGLQVKKDMTQEAVSVTINNSLCLV